MAFAGINYLAVLAAAVAGFFFGALWYGGLGRVWMRALEMTKQPKPTPLPFVFAFACQLVMAFMLAGLLAHLGEVTLPRALPAAASVWLGFVVTTMIVNHRFQGARWLLTVIDAGHWLGVLLVMAAVLGLFGVQSA